MTFAIDANIMIYAVDDMSPYQPAAKKFFERVANRPEQADVFWPSAIAYLRVVTAGERERSGPHCWDVHAVAMPIGNLVSDAHLVAPMVEKGVRTIRSHNRDFRRCPSMRVRDPLEAPERR